MSKLTQKTNLRPGDTVTAKLINDTVETALDAYKTVGETVEKVASFCDDIGTEVQDLRTKIVGGQGTTILQPDDNGIAMARISEQQAGGKVTLATKEYVDRANSESHATTKQYVDMLTQNQAATKEYIDAINAENQSKFNNLEKWVGWKDVIYGVRINTSNSNPETAVTYTDDAIGFTPAKGNNGNYQKGTFDICYPFNKIRPCLLKDGQVVGYLDKNNFAKFEDGATADITSGNQGDVMIEIPHFFYKFEKFGSDLDIKISNTLKDGYTDFAFSYKGVRKDKFYVGAYLGIINGNGQLRSLSDKQPTGLKTISVCRRAAQANGANYEQLSFNKLTALQILYLLKYKSLDSQKALGQGFTNNPVYENRITGVTNQRGMDYGTNSGAGANNTMKLFGIEDFYGNLRQWVDGYNVGADGTNIVLIGDGNFNDRGDGYSAYSHVPNVSTGYGAFTRSVVGDNNLAFTPVDLNGSSSTFYCDSGFVGAGSMPHHGGHCQCGYGGTTGGAFYFNSVSTSGFDITIGARLIYNG